MSQNRESKNERREGFFQQGLSDVFYGDKKRRDLVILFFLIQSYALYAIYTGQYGLAITTSLPAFLLPCTWSLNQRYETILGIPFRFVLRYQGPVHTEAKYSPQHGKVINGPVIDTYLNCLYTIPLALALWYSYLGIVFPEGVRFFVLMAVLSISRQQYWFRKPLFSDGDVTEVLTGLIMPATVSGFITGWWEHTINSMRIEVAEKRADPSELWAVNEGLALVLTCVVFLKVTSALKKSKYHWPEMLFMPYDLYWENSATDEEIAIWETLEWEDIQGKQQRRKYKGLSQEQIEEYEAAEWQEAEERQYQRLGSRISVLKNSKRFEQDAISKQQSGPTTLYRGSSPEPGVLYRGSPSHEDDEEHSSPAAPAVPLHTKLLNQRIRMTARLEKALKTDSAFRERVIESQIKDISAAEADRCRATIKQRLITDALARVARQRTVKPHRASTSLAPRISSYENHKYISIIEDPAAHDIDASDSDSDSCETDVFTLEPDFPDSTFPYRAWSESLIDDFGTTDSILTSLKKHVSAVCLLLGQIFSIAVFLRYALILTGMWPLHPEGGNTADVMRSTIYGMRVVIGAVYAWLLPLTEYWGRIAREVVEFLVNDWFFAVFLVIFVEIGRSARLWLDKGEIGMVFWVLGGVYHGVTGFFGWVFADV